MGTTADTAVVYKGYTYELDALIGGEDPIYAKLRSQGNITTLSIGGVANDEPSGDITIFNTVVRNPGHKKRQGITVRYVTISRTLGTGSVKFKIYRRVPILTKTLFNEAKIGAEITYQGQTDWEFVSRIDEWNSWQVQA